MSHRRRPDLPSGRLAHRLLIERGVDETLLPPEQLRVRERMFLARNFAYAWLTAALIQLGLLLVPADGRHEGVLLAVTGAGVGASIVHFVLYDRIPLGAYQGSLAVGWAAAGVDAWAAGEQAIVSILFFAWIAVYAAATFGLRTLVRQLPLAIVALTVALAGNETDPDPWLAPFAIATIATMCVLVYVGHVRTQRLFTALVEEREARERTVRHRQLVAELGTAALAAESLDLLRQDILARLAAAGHICTIGPCDAPPAPGMGRFEIPGTDSVLLVEGGGQAAVGSDLLGPAGRILGLAEQRFGEEARRVRLESELADARRLEAIGRLAGGVAHDFNNVLTVIIGNTELALHDLPPDTGADEQLREVLEASRRAAALVAQLLALGSRKPVNPGPVDLGTVVHGIEDILRRLLGAGCRLVVEVADDVPPCRAETTQVEQVILNLVANARDAMPAGGTTTITVDRVTSPPDAPALVGDFVALAVHDTGVGMDDETRRRAFEPFFTSKPFGAGTGLGLATVHGILSQSGGGASIESAPGDGTTFRAYLPVYVPEPVALAS